MADSALSRVINVRRRIGFDWGRMDGSLGGYFYNRRAIATKQLAEVKDALWDSPTVDEDFLGNLLDPNLWSAFATGTVPILIQVRNGVVEAATTAVSGTRSGLDFAGINIIRRAQGIKCLMRVQLIQLTQQIVEVGLKNTTNSAAAAAHFIVFRNTPGDAAATWFGRTNDGTTSSAVDTGILGTTSFVELMFIVAPSGGTISFFIDGVLRATQTANLPGDTTDMQPHIYVENSEAAVKRFDVDRFRVWPSIR